jgi:hypothetical protein
MSDERRLLLYLAMILAVSVFAGSMYRTINWTAAVIGCRQHDQADTFLAYCAAPQFGDYEHGGYYLGLERRALDQLRRADVLFFGDSRAQFAFSTSAVKSYFRERSIQFYSLAFGYGERSLFPEKLIRKQRLTPKVLVVDATPSAHKVPFFNTAELSPPTRTVFGEDGPWLFMLGLEDYVLKKAFIRIQAHLCNVIPSLCSGRFGSVYRSTDDGTWIIWNNLWASADQPAFPIVHDPKSCILKEPWGCVRMTKPEAAAAQEPAQEFFRTAGVRPDCVILTSIPNSFVEADEYVIELARLVGAEAALPTLDGLSTIDNLHFSAGSAERWSAALLNQIDSVIKRCTDRRP